MSILRTKPYLVLIIALFGLLSCIPYVWGQPIGFTLNFEKGDLRGWKSTGNAFNYQPTLGDNPTARHRGQPSRHQGRYWIGTYEKYQGLPGQEPGDIQGDKPRGTLTSSPFTIPSGTLSFLIGGGRSFQTRVELLIKDPIEGNIRVLYASGRNTETMQRAKWNLNPYAGKTGQIRIVDASSGGWGHINVDDFRFSSIPVPPLAEVVEVPDVIGNSLNEAREILSDAELRLGQVMRLNSNIKPETVLRQNPPADSKVKRGTPVNLWIAAKRERPVAKINPLRLKVVQGEKAVFESRSTHAPNGWSKEYWTGPGEQTGRGRSFEVNTKVLNPGKYVITLDIVDNYKQSNRTAAALEILPPPVKYRATIEADRDRLEQDQSVRFRASLSPEVPGAEYRFVFGDGMESDWTGGTGIEHLYSSPGLYQASVVVRKGEEIIAESRGVRIEVIPAPVEVTDFRLLLDVGQNRTGPGEAVTFRATLKPYTEGSEYRFVFGDGESSGWGNETTAEHIYSEPGTYSAYVIARLGQKIISESKPVMVDVAAPFPLRRWAVVIVGLLIAFGGYYLFAKINRPKKIKGHLEPAIKIRPQKDIGSQQIRASASIRPDLELRLRAVTDKGKQVIKSENPLIPDRGEE